MTPDQHSALDIARRLAEFGVPVFVARPAIQGGEWNPAGGHNGTGYWLPKGWESTSANPRYVDAWKPGAALCAVMGQGLDLVDLDPRNGGDVASLNGTMPHVYGVAETPSGGFHGFIASLGVRSRDNVLTGIDVKAGDADGVGRGFAFLAPTVRLSKTTGELTAYRWEREPDLAELAKASDDDSGTKLAALISAAHGSAKRAPDIADDDADARPWMTETVIPVGKRYPWLRSYAGWLREKNVRLTEARAMMRQRWQAVEQPADYPMPWEDAEKLLGDIYGRYAAGDEGPAILGDWDDPTPLGQAHPAPLPVDACGPILAPTVHAVSEALQVPPDLVINMALSVIAAAAQGRYRVRIKPDWTEILSLSSTSVANSGERKSPILSTLTRPLIQLERELRDAAKLNSSWRTEQINLAEKRVEQARREAAKNKLKEDELRAEIAQLDDLEPVHLPRLFTDDATPEALLQLLAEQGGSIAVLSAEPGFFATLAGRYSKGVANLDGALKATSGEAVRVDRKGAEPLMIDEPCLSVCVCIQPGLLSELGRKPELRFSGFLARFLYVAPLPMVGTRKVVDEIDRNADSVNSVNYLLDLLSNSSSFFSYIETLGRSSYTRKQLTQLTELTLSVDAQRALTILRADLEPRLHPHTGDLATIADWGSKLPGTIVRIAAALTLLANPEAQTIDGETMTNAVQLGLAYIPHAMWVLNAVRGAGDNLSQARDTLDVILRNGWETFSLRDVSRQLANTSWVKDGSGKPAEVVADEIETLVEFGHVRPLPEEEHSGRGRKPSPRFAVNPKHLEDR